MFQVVSQTQILLAHQPVDFPKGIDALACLCRCQLLEIPFSGTVFIFRNQAGNSLRMLACDGQGFWLCTKRLSKGRLAWWPQPGSRSPTELAARELNTLLWNGNPEKASFAWDWKALPKVS